MHLGLWGEADWRRSKRGWGVGYSDLQYEDLTFYRSFPLSHQKLFKTPNLRVSVTFYLKCVNGFLLDWNLSKPIIDQVV